MKMYPLEKYRYYFAGNKVIATSTYAGRTVRGVALCAPEDEFNEAIGKELAAARCNEKIAAKRYARAIDKYAEACALRDAAIAHVDAMKDYMNDSFLAMNEASQWVDSLTNK